MIMHFPCICTPKLHNTICAYPVNWVLKCASSKSGQECCAFLQAQTLKSINFELRHSMEHGGYTGFCFGSGENPVTTDCCLCQPPDPSRAWAYWYPCVRPTDSFCNCVSSWRGMSRIQVCSLPTCCQWYSWNQDEIHNNFFRQKY